MSVSSKVALGGAFALACGLIAYVHYQQENDRKKMHEGVVKDMERQGKTKDNELHNFSSKNQASIYAKHTSGEGLEQQGSRGDNELYNLGSKNQSLIYAKRASDEERVLRDLVGAKETK